MLKRLFELTQTPNWETGFMLGNVPVWLDEQLDDCTVEMIPRPVTQCFVLRCWRVYLDRPIPVSVPVWPALCGETLVLWTDIKFELTDRNGDPLPGIYYHGRDRRICNKLLASQLIDWTIQ